MTAQQNIANIFSILHDGVIESWTGDKETLTLKVGCEYLAELPDKSFDHFFVELIGVTKIELAAWMNPFDLPPKTFTELQDIFKAKLEILSADKKDDYVLIACNQHDTTFDYCGGNLSLNCMDIKVYDQKMNILTVEKMIEINKSYWDNFSNNEN